MRDILNEYKAILKRVKGIAQQQRKFVVSIVNTVNIVNIVNSVTSQILFSISSISIINGYVFYAH
jgi:hypothetical protein